MKSGYRILLSFYITFVVYSIGTLFLGNAGIVEASLLKNYRNKLVENTTNLKHISFRLESQYNSLISNHELIALKARDLGYLKKDEGQIIIKNYKKKPYNFIVGSFYQRFSNNVLSAEYIRIFSAFIGILTFLILTIFKGNSHVYKKRRSVIG